MVIRYHAGEGGKAPSQAHPGDAGWDICASEDGVILPGETGSIPTALRLEIPEGYEVQVRGRSGLAFKQGMLAHFGTIDSGYRGEVRVLLYNTSREPFVYRQGDRVAQIVPASVTETPMFIPTASPERMKPSSRGEGGYGSSGR